MRRAASGHENDFGRPMVLCGDRLQGAVEGRRIHAAHEDADQGLRHRPAILNHAMPILPESGGPSANACLREPRTAWTAEGGGYRVAALLKRDGVDEGGLVGGVS